MKNRILKSFIQAILFIIVMYVCVFSYRYFGERPYDDLLALNTILTYLSSVVLITIVFYFKNKDLALK